MKSSKVKAFTIAEAMLAILITIICIEILQGTLGIIKKSEKLNDPTNEMVYSYVQLNEFLKEKRHVEINQKSSSPSKLILKSLISYKEDKEPVFEMYHLEKYKNMLRLTGSEGGHIPLLFNIRSSSFAFNEDEFKINVVENNGKASELVFKVDKPLKIPPKKKDDGKDESNKKDKGQRKETSSKRTT